MYLARTPNHYPMKCQYWQMLEWNVHLNWYTIGVLLVNVFRNSNNLPLLVCILIELSIIIQWNANIGIYLFFWRFIRLHSGVFFLSCKTVCVLHAHSRQDASKPRSAKNVKTLWKLWTRASNSKWFMKSNQCGHVSLANASKLGNSHTNYLSAINFSRFDIVVEAINK